MEYRRGSWRGSYRGRGRGQGSWRMDRFSNAPAFAQPRTPSPPVGKSLKELTAKDLVVSGERESNIPTITNCQFVGSYNWLGGIENPVALIPGK